MNRRKLAPLLVLLVAAVLAFGLFKSGPKVERQSGGSTDPLVRVVEVSFRDQPLVVRTQGNSRPAIESTVVAQVAGRIEWTSEAFADGGQYRRGQTLLRIDASDYELAVAQSEASVAQAEVRLERELAEAALAIEEWEQLGYENPSALTVREPQLKEARAGLAAAQASLERAKLNLSRTQVSAPFDGRVRTTLADLGQYVGPGTPLAEVFSTDLAEVQLPIAQSELGFLAEDWSEDLDDGLPVRLRAEIGGREHTWAATVVRASNEIDPRSRMLNLYARIENVRSIGEEPTVTLPMGAFLEADIAGRTVPSVAVLPRAALRDGGRVLVVNGDILNFREVEVLRTQADTVLVSSGLSEGELICVSNIEAPVDGMRVRSQPEALLSGSGDSTEQL